MTRPSWSEVAIAIAVAASPRGECVRRRVDAVVMAPDHSILSVGVNGVPAGEPSCLASPGRTTVRRRSVPTERYVDVKILDSGVS